GTGLNGQTWYHVAGLDPAWPTNPDPGVNQGGDCASCHKAGTKGGRLPTLNIGGKSPLEGYLGVIVARATGTFPTFDGTGKVNGIKTMDWSPAKPTMPLGALKNLKEYLPDIQKLYTSLDPTVAIVPNLFTNDPTFISAPSVVGPVNQCATKVAVQGAILGATVTLYINGAPAGTVANARSPSQIEFAVPPLDAGAAITASQTVDGVSNISPAVVVEDYFTKAPAGLPAPSLEETPIFECANAIFVVNEPGATVTLFQNGTQVAQVATSTADTIIPLTNGPPFEVGDMFEAYQTLCGSTSSNSYPVYALEAPTNLDAPSLDNLQTYPGQQLVALDTLANGSQVTIAAAGVGTIGLFSPPEALLPEF